MRVLQVCPRYPPNAGGVETHVRELSERLVERGHDVVVHTADAGADVARVERRNGVEVRRHRGVAPDDAFHVAPGVFEGVRRADADVVHAHNYHSLPLLFATLAAAVGEAPFVATPHYHGGSADGLRDALLSAYRVPGGRALRSADAVIAVSEWERERLERDFGVDATVIPNGLDVSRFRDADPEHRERPYLLCVGRLEAYKGVDDVIRALPDLPGYELVVAGTGPDRERLDGVARKHDVAERVAFEGYVADDRLPGLYAGAAVYCNLSSFEAYGMTVAEALAAGTPCVVREAGALVDWTGRAGVAGVADPTPSRVAAAVNEVAGTEPEADGLLGWDGVVARVAAEYNSVLSPSAGV